MYEERKGEGVSYEKFNGVNCFILIMRITGFDSCYCHCFVNHAPIFWPGCRALNAY